MSDEHNRCCPKCGASVSPRDNSGRYNVFECGSVETAASGHYSSGDYQQSDRCKIASIESELSRLRERNAVLERWIADPPKIEGKLPWDFCCSWYRVEEIERSIAEKLKRHGSMMHDLSIDRIPTDVASREFAEWLTHEYRLAMNKGIDIAFSTISHPAPQKPETDDEIDR